MLNNLKMSHNTHSNITSLQILLDPMEDKLMHYKALKHLRVFKHLQDLETRFMARFKHCYK